MTLPELMAQMAFARDYSLKLIDTVPPEDWYWTPSEGVFHVAWQVGHLAMAQYSLVMERIRGARPEDDALIPAEFLERHRRGAAPLPRQEGDPGPEEIRRIFDGVDRAAREAMGAFPEAELDAPVLKPHAFCKTKRQCLLWCSQHEMMHAGQIALLRRLRGQSPLW